MNETVITDYIFDLIRKNWLTRIKFHLTVHRTKYKATLRPKRRQEKVFTLIPPARIIGIYKRLFN